MIYTKEGNCPRCGAPIFSFQSPLPLPLERVPGNLYPIEYGPPVAHFTCECRETLPKLMPGDPPAVPSIDEADRAYVEKEREKARERGANG